MLVMMALYVQIGHFLLPPLSEDWPNVIGVKLGKALLPPCSRFLDWLGV